MTIIHVQGDSEAIELAFDFVEHMQRQAEQKNSLAVTKPVRPHAPSRMGEATGNVVYLQRL